MQAAVLGEWTEPLCKAKGVPFPGHTLGEWNTDEFSFTHHLCKALSISDQTAQLQPCFDMASFMLKDSYDRQIKCFERALQTVKDHTRFVLCYHNYYFFKMF